MNIKRSHGYQTGAWVGGFLRLLACCWMIALFSLPVVAEEPVRIGVLAHRPKHVTLVQWQPLADLLQREIPHREFEIIPLYSSELELAATRRQLDFVLTNPASYIRLQSHKGIGSPLATLQLSHNGHPISSFGGVIFTRHNSNDMHVLPDILGKKVAFTSTDSFGGYQMQELELLNQGVSMRNDVERLPLGMPHDNVVRAVLSGQADVGLVRTGVLESMAKDGLLDMKQIKVLNTQLAPGFPYKVSTALYPEWAFMYLTDTDEKLARHVTATLFMLDAKSDITKQMEIHGFTAPADYTVVANLMRELRSPPFDKSPPFTLQDVVARYHWYLVGGVLVLGGILTLLLYLLAVRKRLAGKQRVILEQQAKLQLSASVFLNSSEAIFIVSIANNRIVDVNDSFLEITGYFYHEVIGKSTHFLRSERHNSMFFENIRRLLLEKHHWHGEIWIKRKTGQTFPSVSTISTVHNEDGSIQYIIILFSDVTDLRKHQQELVYAAHYDALTGLPNRILMGERLRHSLDAVRTNGKKLAVVYLDLDNFKVVNDQHGHAMGDQLILVVAMRMKKALREGDILARLGGDEFVAVLMIQESERDTDMLDTIPLLNDLLAAAAEPVQIGDKTFAVSASLGVTFYPQNEDVDADILLRQSDYAMYQAKQTGKNRYHIFDPEHDRNLRGLHESVQRIQQALCNNEFVLYYQPKVNMRTHTVEGVEALIRWQHPEHGLLAPAAFLPFIEDNPVAIEVGEWVINTALSQIRYWSACGLKMPVSVNIDAQQLQQPDFCQRLRDTLAQYPDVKPTYLTMEVLETSALKDLDQVSHVIEECHAMGIYFALDDFGTGYSSLTYLKHLQVSMLKIDRSFVRDMLEDPDDLAILESIIGLANSFRRQVLAEGVETMAHGTLLLELGCELVQGYGIAQPMPAEELPQWVTAWQDKQKPCIDTRY
jgi:diguanylate cyclase (GGDEF)-like protein/PAS domain S-box-containing protein